MNCMLVFGEKFDSCFECDCVCVAYGQHLATSSINKMQTLASNLVDPNVS